MAHFRAVSVEYYNYSFSVTSPSHGKFSCSVNEILSTVPCQWRHFPMANFRAVSVKYCQLFLVRNVTFLWHIFVQSQWNIVNYSLTVTSHSPFFPPLPCSIERHIHPPPPPPHHPTNPPTPTLYSPKRRHTLSLSPLLLLP